MFGDSRPQTAFNPLHFDILSNQSTISYNIAIPRIGAEIEHVLLKIILNRIKLDILFFELNMGDFELIPSEYNAFFNSESVDIIRTSSITILSYIPKICITVSRPCCNGSNFLFYRSDCEFC
jgi:hypothetical protein